jgi:hypothetical protein
METPDYREMMVSAAKKQRAYLGVIALIAFWVILAGLGMYYIAQQFVLGCLSLHGTVACSFAIIVCFLIIATPCCKIALKIKTGVEEAQNDN